MVPSSILQGSNSPLRYDPSVEMPAADGAETTQGLIETMRGISQTTLKHEGHPIRSVHAKSHALLEGSLEVFDGLPAELAQGLFARSAIYPVVMRFSTIPGDLLDDSVSTPRGVAIKVLGVEGARLPGSESARTQDFIFVNGPAFAAPTPKAFLSKLKLLAATTDRVHGLKKAVSAVLRTVQKGIVAVSGKPNPTVAALGGQAETHILGDTFFSQTPFRYGDYVAKMRLRPASPDLVALTDKPISTKGAPDALRDVCNAFFRAHEARWEFQVQLRTNDETMPVEDASKVWPEAESPYLTVARLTAPSQVAWSPARSAVVDQDMAFSVWHGLLAHQPLGGVNRTRKQVYDRGRAFRADHSGHAISEPKEAVALPN